MEAIRTTETSGATHRTTRRHIPEDDTLHYNPVLIIGNKMNIEICVIRAALVGQDSRKK
jgi:hypothetical protein